MIDVKFLLNKINFQPLDLPKLDSGVVIVDSEKLLISAKDTLAADGAVKFDSGSSHFLVKDNKGEKCSLDKADDATGLVDSSPVMLLKRKLISKDPGDHKGSKGKRVAGGPDNLGLTASSQKITSRFPETKKKYVEEKSLDENARNDVLKLVDSGKNSLEDPVLPTTAVEDRKPKLLVGKHRPTGAVAKGLADDRPLKKHKLGDTSPHSCDSGGTGTLIPAIVVGNEASHSTDIASEYNDGGCLALEVDGVSNGLPKNIKFDGSTVDESNDKHAVVSVHQSNKQGFASAYVPAHKASQPDNGGAPTENHNLSWKMVGSGNGLLKKLKSNSVVEDESNDKLHKLPIKKQPKNLKIEASQHVKEVTQRPPDRSKWFSELPWEERLREAHDQGKLVLLHNLFPAYTSSEIEDIIWKGFEVSCTAKVVQRTAPFSRSSGKAFVIFKTREIAEKALRKLDKDCLMLPNGRPLVGSRGVVYFPGKYSSFPGHLAIDKLRHQMLRNREKRFPHHILLSQTRSNMRWHWSGDYCKIKRTCGGTCYTRDK